MIAGNLDLRQVDNKPTVYTNLGWFSKDGYRPSLPLGVASKVIPGSSSSLLLGMGPTGASIVGELLPF